MGAAPAPAAAASVEAAGHDAPAVGVQPTPAPPPVKPAAQAGAAPRRPAKPAPARRRGGRLVLGLFALLLVGALLLWATVGGGWERISGQPRLEALVEETLKPSIMPQTVRWEDQVEVTVPGGLLQDAVKLTISSVSDAPAFEIDGFAVGAVYDVSLGDLHTFDQPLTIELAYDPARLDPDLPAEDQLAAAYWNPDEAMWALLPVEVDPEQATLTVQTRHLSVIGEYYIHAEKFSVKRREHFRIIYDNGLNSRIEVDGKVYYGMERYAYYAGVALEQAYAAYEEAGFDMPAGPIDVLIGDWKTIFTLDILTGRRMPLSSYWSPGAGAIYIISGAGYKEMSFDAAHELFHLVQYQDLDLNEMSGLRWWMEATADYAAGRVAWSRGDPPARFMGEAAPPNYLQVSIEYMSENNKDPHYRHQYHTAHFVDFLVQGVSGGVDSDKTFFNMWDYVAGEINRNDGTPYADDEDVADDWNVPLHLDRWSNDRLRRAYREFAGFYLFNQNSPLVAKPKDKVPAEAAGGNWAYLGSGDRQVASKPLELPAYYSAGLWGVVVQTAPNQASRQLYVEAVDPLPEDVEVYVYLLPQDQRRDLPFGQGPVPVGTLNVATQEVALDVPAGSGLYALAANYSLWKAQLSLRVRDAAQASPTVPPTEVESQAGPRINQMSIGANVPTGWHPMTSGLLEAVRDNWQKIETSTGITPGENGAARWKASLSVSGDIISGYDPDTSAEGLAQQLSTTYQDWNPTVSSGTIQVGGLSGFYAEARCRNTSGLYNLVSYDYFFVALVWDGDAHLYLQGQVEVDAREDPADAEVEQRFDRLVGELWQAVNGIQLDLVRK